ncbi:MAG: ATP12 family protein, partial [Pseudomonadota bacterium]
LSMPVTRAVNTAIERVAPQRDAVIDDIAGYAASDLLCHRADRPAGLAAAQAAAWDPPLVWLAEAVGARLAVTAGVMPSAQSPKALKAVRAAVARRSDLELTALHELTTLSGSVALALMVAEAAIPAAQAWRASRVDEEWQIAEWGRDEEAEAAAARRARAFLEADALLRLLG